MEKPIYRFHELFAQLGLPHREEDILQFIESHRPLNREIDLPDAPFWSPSQASFLREALEQDSNWSELVDQLNTALREQSGEC